MDAQGSSSTREKCSPEAIPSTGLSIIYEPETDAPIVDIVFVHGLKGHPYKTWRCKQTPKNVEEPPANSGKEAPKSNTSKRLEFRQSFKAFLKGSSSNNRQGTSLTESTCNIPSTAETGDLSVCWPADLLPQICNKARILTFGYDTKITKFTSGPTNTNSIFSHGKDFLFSLGREYVHERPMIFVAHSLGGILVKEMLALSSTSETLAHKGIIESTAAIVFLGTPHRGSPELSAIGEWARSMLSGLKFQTTSTILDTLGLKTTDLERAHEAFCRLWHQYDFQVKTFQESFGLTGIDLGVLGNKVVPHESSLIGDPREHAETLQANHKQMSRFSGPQDPNFIKIAGEIKAYYTAIENAHAGKLLSAKMIEGNNAESLNKEGVQEVLEHKVLEELLAALRFDGMNTRREAISTPPMRNWLIRNPKFRLWTVAADQNENLLFIKGKPGAGKSTLMKDTVRLMKDAQRRDRNFICADFFVDASGKPLQRCSAGIFRSLLYQLLSQSKICSAVTSTNSERDTLISSIKDIVSSDFMPSKVLSETLVQNLLTQTFLYLGSLGTAVVIFVDALDELGVEMQRQQVDFWSIQQQCYPRLRICLSCREFPNITVDGCLELSLGACNQDDISTYIAMRLHKRISRHEPTWARKLTGRIHSLSSGVFLWVVLVVDEVLRSYDNGASLPWLLRLIEETPPELEKLYERILDFDAVLEDRLMIGRMFQWVLAANRPLRLDEWHHILAFVQPSKPASLAEWRRSESFTENDNQLERKIKSLSRGLLEVSTKQQDVLAEKNDEISSIDGGVGSLDHEEGSARVVRVIHQSVYDFFIHRGGFQKLGLESVNPIADCHCTITNTCIDYLFIPELDEYFVARRRVDMASLLSASLCSKTPVETEEPPAVDPLGNIPGSTLGFEGLKTLRPWQPSEVVEEWLARGTLASYPGTIADSANNSVSRESLAAAPSQILDDYPALLVYAITEIMVHIDLAELDLNPTKETQKLITRLRDSNIWKRLRTLQQGKRARQRTTEWLEAVAQNRLPPRPKTCEQLPAMKNGPRSPRSITSFSSASDFSHRSYESHGDKKD